MLVKQMFLRRVVAAHIVAVTLIAAVTACAGNVKPETQVAHYGTNVLAAATELQKGITAATDAKTIPVEMAQGLTDKMAKLHGHATTLGEKLKQYRAATTLDVKNMTAAEIQKLVGDINGVLGEVLGTKFPDGAVQQFGLLAGNVMAAVGAVQAEVAKGLGGS